MSVPQDPSDPEFSTTSWQKLTPAERERRLQDPSAPEFSTTSWQRLSGAERQRRIAIGIAVTGALFLAVTVGGYIWIEDAVANAESDSIGEGYGFMTIFLIFPCVLGVILLVVGGGLMLGTGGSRTPPNA